MAVQHTARPLSEHAFDGVAAFYDAWFSTPLGNTVDALETDLLYAFATPRSGERTLEVGTGTGHFAAELAQRGWSVVGLDLSAPMLAMAASKGTAAHWLRGDAAALPFCASAFDLVLCVTALEFVANRERAVEEMWRVVRPGGRLVIAGLNACSPWAWARRRESQTQETPFSHAHFFHPGEFVGMLRRFGRVAWSSSVFIGPQGGGLRGAWELERVGRLLLKPFGALIVGRVVKCR
jgi:ubiquinone/menaquinone biosynthesis C-methylase UbiE